MFIRPSRGLLSLFHDLATSFRFHEGSFSHQVCSICCGNFCSKVSDYVSNYRIPILRLYDYFFPRVNSGLTTSNELSICLNKTTSTSSCQTEIVPKRQGRVNVFMDLLQYPVDCHRSFRFDLICIVSRRIVRFRIEPEYFGYNLGHICHLTRKDSLTTGAVVVVNCPFLLLMTVCLSQLASFLSG